MYSPNAGDIDGAVTAVENLLRYSFNEKTLLELEEALTDHLTTDTEGASSHHLEFLGDAALRRAVTKALFWAFPNLDSGQRSLLRSANVSTERLARVAVRRGLHRYILHNTNKELDEVKEFALAVQEEDDAVVHGGKVKAPKVLADIVLSVAGAVYDDCKSDLQVFWTIFGSLLAPIVGPELLQQQPQPVSMLFELCHKDLRQVVIKHWREGEKDTASVFVDGKFVASASSENKEIAKLNVARTALKQLCMSEKMDVDCSLVDGTTEINGAKGKLHKLCGKKGLPKPCYRIVKEYDPFLETGYVCSVEVKIATNELQVVQGDEMSRVRDAENSAALRMLRAIEEESDDDI